jgi:hypothetical protein
VEERGAGQMRGLAAKRVLLGCLSTECDFVNTADVNRTGPESVEKSPEGWCALRALGKRR